MRYCEDKDYLKHGISIESVHKFGERLCPDFGDDFENYKVDHNFNSKVNQTSFSLQIRMCDYFDDPKCKSKNEIKTFLSFFYCSVYNIKTKVNFDAFKSKY